MVIRGRCPHCGGLLYLDTETHEVVLSKEDLGQLRLEIAERQQEAHPEVDQSSEE